MGFKNRNVCFYGLMIGGVLFFSMLICGCITITIYDSDCCQCPQEGRQQGVDWGQKVHGIAYHDVNGNNKRDTGEPTISGAYVKLDGVYDYSTNRNSVGYYTLSPLAGGYTAICSAQGYATRTTSIDVDVGETVPLSFGMSSL